MTDDAPRPEPATPAEPAGGRTIPNEPQEPAPAYATPPQVRSLDEQRRRRPRPPDTNRIPPHNLQAEESLLGAMLLAADAIWAAADIVDASDFYKPAHGHIHAAIADLAGRGEPADPVTVADQLRRANLLDQVGGASVLNDLIANTPGTRNAERYAHIVADHATLRRLIATASEIAELAYTTPTDLTHTRDHAETLLFNVTDPRRQTNTITMHDAVEAFLDRLSRLYDNPEPVGVTTGFVDLDRVVYGWEPNQLAIVAARPSMGKSQLAGAFATNAARAGHPVLVVSAEMSHSELTDRHVAAHSGIDLDRIKTGRLADNDWPHISRAISRLADLPIDTCDDPTVTLMTIRALARRAIRQHGQLDLVIVDYLQLMTPLERSENRNVEVSEISRGLKKLAGDLHVPVIALSQLSRNLEQRRDKHPILSDLRDSGSLEQDADKVLLLYRDEVYNPKTEDKGIMEINVAKHRNGPTGLARLAYEPHRSRFGNLVQT